MPLINSPCLLYPDAEALATAHGRAQTLKQAVHHRRWRRRREGGGIHGSCAGDRIIEAALTYQRRQARQEHPAGKFDRGRRWWPADDEWQDCCASVRSPSRSFPYSLMVHCRTLTHVARLYDVDERELRRLVRTAQFLTEVRA